jgi:hypothetical protein
MSATPTYDSALTIPARFCGPSASGNGGYTAGTLAERVRAETGCPVVEVTLRQPPPLDVAMTVQHLPADEPTNVTSASVTRLLLGGSTIAEATCVDLDVVAVEAVSLAEATEASAGYPGLRRHPFPTCFACGPERGDGDGLRIFPGPVGNGAGHGRVAAPWIPHPALAERSDLLDEGVQLVGLGVTWAALDCVGWWAGDMEERAMVLGRMTAQVDALPVVGEQHVVVGAARGREGRKTFTASTLYDSDGRIVARAQHVWVAVDPSTFR